jgi:hypothetical protein
MAMEMTSEEIISEFPEQSISLELREQLKEMLYRADLVKFAKYQPLTQEHETSLAHAYNFVRSTYREEGKTEIKTPSPEVVAS